MPFTENDPKLPDRIKSLPAAKRRQWARVWNSVFENCQGDKATCESAAFRQANGAITKDAIGDDILDLIGGQTFTKAIDVDGLTISLDTILAALKIPHGGQVAMLRQAQAKRAKQFGVQIQAGAALSMPANFSRSGLTLDDLGDRTNFRFAIWLSKPDRAALSAKQLTQVKNAKTQFDKIKDRYDELSRAAITIRIDEAHKKFGLGKFSLEKAWVCQVFKADEEKQIAFSVALKASGGDNGIRPDTQRDIISAEGVEETAHRFMVNSRKFDLHHKETLSQKRAAVVESYLAPVEFQAGQTLVKRGDWVVAVKFFDEALWNDVKAGKIRAFSIKGVGRRRKFDT